MKNNGYRCALLLLALCLLLPQLTSCTLLYSLLTGNEYTDEWESTLPEPYTFAKDDPAWQYGKLYLGEEGVSTVYPEVRASALEYTLTQADLYDFNELLADCRAFYQWGEEQDEDEFWTMLCELNSAYAAITVQCDIANLRHRLDPSDEKTEEQRVQAYCIEQQAKEALWGWYGEVRHTPHPLLAIFDIFMDDEYPNRIERIAGTEESQIRMEEIEAEYATLGSSATVSQIFALYHEYTLEAHTLAKAYRYDNYYDYLTKESYDREYTKEEREQFRYCVKKYLVPLCFELRDRSRAVDAGISRASLNLANRYIGEDFRTVAHDELLAYLNSLPISVGARMKSAFAYDRVLIAERPDAARVSSLITAGVTPILYFAPSDVTLMSVSHQLGYYYDELVNGHRNIAMDLQQTYAAANSLLMLRYMDELLPRDAYECYRAYTLYNTLYQTIVSTIRDEFDEIVYSDPAAITSPQQLEDIILSLIEAYGVGDLTERITWQLTTYWQRYAFDYVGNNLGFALADVVALQLYRTALTDYDRAAEYYRKLVEEVDPKGTFLATLRKAGIGSPFDERTYDDSYLQMRAPNSCDKSADLLAIP